MGDSSRHFEMVFKVHFEATYDVKHTLKRSGWLPWPLNRRRRRGNLRKSLECDDCLVFVAEPDLPRVVEMIKGDTSFKELLTFFSRGMSEGGFDEWDVEWHETEYLNRWKGEFFHRDFAGAEEESTFEDYVEWSDEESKALHYEFLREMEEELLEPKRRIVAHYSTLDSGVVTAPWSFIKSDLRGSFFASGVFYPDFPKISVNHAELVGITLVTTNDDSDTSQDSREEVDLERLFEISHAMRGSQADED